LWVRAWRLVLLGVLLVAAALAALHTAPQAFSQDPELRVENRVGGNGTCALNFSTCGLSDIAQSFIAPQSTFTIDNVILHLSLNIGVPVDVPGDIRVDVYDDASGLPGIPIASSGVFDASTLGNLFSEVTFPFSGANRITIDENTPYWIVLTTVSAPMGSEALAVDDEASGGYGFGTQARFVCFAFDEDVGDTCVSAGWVANNRDIYFAVYGETIDQHAVFAEPVTGVTVACIFNYRRCASPGRYHAGIDYFGDPEVVTVAPGRVVVTQANGDKDHGLGNTVIVEHEVVSTGQIVYSLYAHLAAFAPGVAQDTCLGAWVSICW
jgi:hypothetical protein